LAFRSPVSVAPGRSVTLRYVYGIAHPQQIALFVARYRAARDPLGASELVWDAYLLRSATMYEEACGHHTITQGGYYQYDTGANLGYRSWPHYLLPMTYADPALTRDVLRYTI